MISAPITSIQGLSGVRLCLKRWAPAPDRRCGGWRSYIACMAGEAPTGSCDGRPQPAWLPCSIGGCMTVGDTFGIAIGGIAIGGIAIGGIAIGGIAVGGCAIGGCMAGGAIIGCRAGEAIIGCIMGCAITGGRTGGCKIVGRIDGGIAGGGCRIGGWVITGVTCIAGGAG